MLFFELIWIRMSNCWLVNIPVRSKHFELFLFSLLKPLFYSLLLLLSPVFKVINVRPHSKWTSTLKLNISVSWLLLYIDTIYLIYHYLRHYLAFSLFIILNILFVFPLIITETKLISIQHRFYVIDHLINILIHTLNILCLILHFGNSICLC